MDEKLKLIRLVKEKIKKELNKEPYVWIDSRGGFNDVIMYVKDDQEIIKKNFILRGMLFGKVGDKDRFKKMISRITNLEEGMVKKWQNK